ncbi:tetratricopeptide repeat protein, partial [Escherichia coli]|nr:tetratricopeptide repeat protein [Escherichia coli]
MATVTDSLKQAVAADPANLALLRLLADVYSRGGQMKDAAALLTSAADKLTPQEPAIAAEILASLGDLYLQNRLY